MKLVHVASALVLVVGLSGLSCAPADDSGGSGSGGNSGSGGAASGGSGSGGSSSGGSSSGGSGSGGSSSGGAGGKGQGGAKGGNSGGGGSSGGGFAAVATILGTSCGTGTCHDGTQHVPGDIPPDVQCENREKNRGGGARNRCETGPASYSDRTTLWRRI